MPSGGNGVKNKFFTRDFVAAPQSLQTEERHGY